MKTLLISTIGGQVGHGILKVLASLRDRVRVVGLNSIAEASLNFHCDAAYLVPPTADRAAWLARVGEILAAESPTAVVPTRDEDLALLAVLKADPAFAKIAFFCAGPRTAAIVAGKEETARFAQAQGLPFVDTAWDPSAVERLLATHGFPLIVKPRSASGGAGVRALTRRSEVDAWLARGGVVFQPFIGAPEDLGGDAVDPALGIPLGFNAPWRSYLNPTVTVGLDGRLAYRGCSHLEPRSGSSNRSYHVEDREIEAMALDYAKALSAADFVGTATLQGRRDRQGRFVPFEICGRISGGVYSRSLIGLHELGDVLALLVPGLPLTPPSTASIVHKVFDWHRFDAEDAARLNADKVWHDGACGPRAGQG